MCESVLGEFLREIKTADNVDHAAMINILVAYCQCDGIFQLNIASMTQSLNNCRPLDKVHRCHLDPRVHCAVTGEMSLTGA